MLARVLQQRPNINLSMVQRLVFRMHVTCKRCSSLDASRDGIRGGGVESRRTARDPRCPVRAAG